MAKNPLVVVDPGHGGSDPGAMNFHSGRRESDLNLAIALAFQEISGLAPFDVVLLRSVDSFMSLRDRARLANWAAAAVFLSFHCNAAENPSARGFEVWTTPGETKSDRLATLIHKALGAALPTIGRVDYDDGDPDKEAQFYVLRKTVAPAVLIEFGFISNQDDEVMLADPEKQLAMATAVRDAVIEWLG